MRFKNKYNKYKNKYLELVTKIGGSSLNKEEIMNYYNKQKIKSLNNKNGYNNYVIKSFKKKDNDGNNIPTQNPVNMMYCESNYHYIAAILVMILNILGIKYFNKSLDNIILIMDTNKLVEVYNDSLFLKKSENQQLTIVEGDRPVSDHYLIKGYFLIKDYKYETLIKLGSLNLEGLCYKHNLESKERQKELTKLLNKNDLDIICFQELSLKSDENNGWHNRKKNIEILQNNLPNFNLLGDNYTSKIGYDKYSWKLLEVLDIRRMGKEKKKSNAYKLESLKNGVKIIVVNIHLKAWAFNSYRISELEYIFNQVKAFSLNFTIPVFLVGDFNDDLKNIEYIIKGFK